MKKIILTLTAVFAFSVNALGYTWVDKMTDDLFIGSGQTQTYTHDISAITSINPIAFTVGEDKIFSYDLDLYIYNARGNKSLIDIAMIAQGGGKPTKDYLFNYFDNNLGCTIDGLAQLNSSGKLTVSIKALGGAFYINESDLFAFGNNVTTAAAPVPEPGTMVLLGFGLLGLAIYSKRRMNKEA